jgi:hypothetical protein
MITPMEKLTGIGPFSLTKAEKRRLYNQTISELTRHHYHMCPPYRLILDTFGHNHELVHSIEDYPMLPVRLFKNLELISVPNTDIVKVMKSSGTSGQAVSKIYLDKQNARDQSKALTRIISSFIGPKRLPLLVLDSEMVKFDRSIYSARGAGIIGFSNFGIDTTYALGDNMELNTDKVRTFFDRYAKGTVLMFGYTSIIWQHVLQEMDLRDMAFPIANGTLFHVGGWKKLIERQVDTATFNSAVQRSFGNVKIHNYYGMAEQLGSVFVECEHGHLHCSIYSDVIIRSHADFTSLGPGEKGLIELLSILPSSYPGHVILTEDEGELLGEDDCPCGRYGKYFVIHGRIRGAEKRGCSDTYEPH